MRIGRHPNNVTRFVLELAGNPRYSAFPMYDPFRLVIDVESADAGAPTPTATPAPTPPPTTVVAPPPAMAMSAKSKEPAPARTGGTPVAGTPEPPSSNRSGEYSLSRQLGLGVSRIVVDAGHGGHDPGAQANGIDESELTLDVAQRLQKLLEAQPGFAVVLTRSTDDYIALEERTAIANREGADLFLSIHANASRQPSASGIETYFLNFATNPTAEAVAARENASSGQNMGTLPDILKAIALNNKLAESRELASIVQTSLVRRLGPEAVAVLGPAERNPVDQGVALRAREPAGKVLHDLRVGVERRERLAIRLAEGTEAQPLGDELRDLAAGRDVRRPAQRASNDRFESP